MVDPRTTRTNAADSAPGVDDGRRGAPRSPIDSRPAGRKVVLWGVMAALFILALALFSKPTGDTAVNAGMATDQTAPRTAPVGAE